MPKYFCEYCGIYLTNSSPRTRREHSHGRKHIANKIEFYSHYLYDYQQNTYNNLAMMVSKINNPSSITNTSSIGMQQANNFRRLIVPMNEMQPTVPGIIPSINLPK
jgi:hypothetical protein